MTRRLLSLLLIVLLLPSGALAASRQYIIPDSDTRYLSESELWEWDYESLGYIFNEIFARHGYNFVIGSCFYNYFNSRPWYTPNADPDNSRACYPKLNNVEWANERLCKEVRETMRNRKTTNPGGMHYLDYIETKSFDVLSGFTYANLPGNQKWPVYAAPNPSAWRGANGKAAVSTNGSVYVAGWENGWLLLMYATNNGAVRVGYANGSGIKGKVNVPQLQFSYATVTCVQDASLTDDPATASTALRQLRAGDVVTYLTSYQNRFDWAYVETTVNGQAFRGFIPLSALDMGMGLTENEDVADNG